jgi:hypothetical protein
MVVDPVTLVVGGTATVLVVSSLAFLEWRAAKKRTAAFHAFAQNMGLTVDSDALSALEALSPFKVWRAGSAQRAKNILIGTRDGRHVTLFDFGYTTGSGKNSQKHTHTVCVVAAPSTAPDFLVRRRTVLDKLARVFHGQAPRLRRPGRGDVREGVGGVRRARRPAPLRVVVAGLLRRHAGDLRR